MRLVPTTEQRTVDLRPAAMAFASRMAILELAQPTSDENSAREAFDLLEKDENVGGDWVPTTLFLLLAPLADPVNTSFVNVMTIRENASDRR